MHVGIIPDGNRRYMRKKGIGSLAESYQSGISRFYDLLQWCPKYGINEVTIYALSTENIKERGDNEIKALFKVFSEHAKKALTDQRIKEAKIRIKICGDIDYLTQKSNEITGNTELIENLRALEKHTEKNDGLRLNMALAYGGRQEIVFAASKLAQKGLPITEENIQSNLWVKDNADFIIRTSEKRISNFLLWQSAYSEIYFIDKLWQEITEDDLAKVVSEFKQSDRRFGR
ncbi:Tritrans,polycis-undecaprenyl-diphosphate synthase (GGDP specific) [uncultured archaeon]|nr:Tritrans,polycis-undecaprenyl-diphosphate synthase (GGDP specific) [uncultured archaeon]